VVAQFATGALGANHWLAEIEAIEV
jgi:hypothetical protein